LILSQCEIMNDYLETCAYNIIKGP
jgi:hypothetical protein